MRKLILILFLFPCFVFCQQWSQYQMDAANTAKHISILTKEEKEVIMYVNLARIYPKDFAKIEIQDSTGEYEASLIKTLNTMNPVTALIFDKELYKQAKCFAKESGENGIVGHKRIACPDITVGGECCAYGNKEGRNIVVQLLIDRGVPSLVHRKICLDSKFKKIGVSNYSHKTYGFCSVMDLLW